MAIDHDKMLKRIKARVSAAIAFVLGEFNADVTDYSMDVARSVFNDRVTINVDLRGFTEKGKSNGT